MVRPRQEFFNVSLPYLSSYLAIYLSVYKILYRELGMVRPQQEFFNGSCLCIYLSIYLSV